jgi:hypothetical protein
MEEKLSIIGIKTNEGIYITKFNENSSWGNFNDLSYYKINGEHPKKSFDLSWNIIKEEPVTITREISPIKSNFRYELRDPSLASEKIPASLARDLVWQEEEGWSKEYKHLESLYVPAWDETPQPDMIIDFEYKLILETDELPDSRVLDWDISGRGVTRKVKTSDLDYQVLDKIRFPRIYYETHCPVMLPSPILYNIIRTHIKNNIDPTKAFIKSDYDFCFTVNKRISLEEPKNIKEQIMKRNGKSYNPPKFVDKFIKYADDVKVFEMTSEKDKYSKYPVLPSLYAESVSLIEEKVNNILNELMAFINAPLTVCAHCKGSGVIHEIKLIDLNELINGK